jgi:hypothetical protein
MSSQPTETWFTTKRMRDIALAILIMDCILAVIWIFGAAYVLYQKKNNPDLCFGDQFVLHMLILFHFVLAMAVAGIYSEIQKEAMRYRDRKQPLPEVLPFEIYTPFLFFFASFIALSGDTVLLANAAIDYDIGDPTDACRAARIAHISYDTIALLVSVTSVIWFILFSTLTISPERRRRKKQGIQ